MKTAVFLIWIHLNSYGVTDQKEFKMNSWKECIEASESAQIVNNNPKESISLFCVVK
jgi:hypothetical protein